MDDKTFYFTQNFNNTGLSTDEAISQSKEMTRQQLEGHLAKSMPRFLAKRITPLVQIIQSKMLIICDGYQCSATTNINGRKNEQGIWEGTQWISAHNLDFCPKCQENGKMQQAIQMGIVPHDSRNK